MANEPSPGINPPMPSSRPADCWRHFTLRVKHDAGSVTIRTVGPNEGAARKMICAAERCPERAIRRVWAGKPI